MASAASAPGTPTSTVSRFSRSWILFEVRGLPQHWEAALGLTSPRRKVACGGPLEEGHPNYWRRHGLITLIEYDNTQNDANHIHSVWHDLTNNWGRDPLREHYAHG
jgi:hypothetical protein